VLALPPQAWPYARWSADASPANVKADATRTAAMIN
jgi:hypothetical protein